MYNRQQELQEADESGYAMPKYPLSRQSQFDDWCDKDTKKITIQFGKYLSNLYQTYNYFCVDKRACNSFKSS